MTSSYSIKSTQYKNLLNLLNLLNSYQNYIFLCCVVLLFDNAANCIPNDIIKFHLISLVGKSSKCREMDIVIEEYFEANTILLFFLLTLMIGFFVVP